jgi:molecular chaperone DnaK (HSP70)
LGGGTFDVSVVAMEGEVVEVLASHGDNQLGGDDFDQKLVEHILAHLQQAHGVDASDSPQAMARIRRAAEAAKIALSDRPYATIEEEYLLEHEGRPVNLSMELSREDYETMIGGYVDETLAAVHTALEGASLTVSDLDEVLLVGGATRTPLIPRRLEAELGIQPRGEVDPELCVATGAATQAAVIGGASVNTVLVDITPYTFGTSTLGELNGAPYMYCFAPIIRKNTPIPVTKSEVFYTVVDGQPAVDVQVFQGENRDALQNTRIGSFKIEGLRGASAGDPVVMTLALDLDGILHVTAREKQTGLEKSIRIDRAMSRTEAEGMASARERIGRLFEGAGAEDAETADTGAIERRQTTEAKALVEKAERLMEGASAEDREDLVDGIEQVNDAIAAADAEALAAAVDQLSDLIYYLEA